MTCLKCEVGSVILGVSLATTQKKHAITRSKNLARSCWQCGAALIQADAISVVTLG